MISPEGTFDYVFDVNADLGSGASLTGRLRETVQPSAWSRRLAGHAPLLSGVEYQREAWQLYARFTLVPSDPENASVAQASFSVERGLLRVLRPGDVLHLSLHGGLALSILRDDSLIAAAGAITAVPLGVDVVARVPGDLIRQAESVFRTRDPDYQMHDAPFELSIAGETRLLHWGRPTMGPFDVFVRHGCRLGGKFDGGGQDACASIERRGVCPDTAAHTSAQLFDQEGVELVR